MTAPPHIHQRVLRPGHRGMIGCLANTTTRPVLPLVPSAIRCCPPFSAPPLSWTRWKKPLACARRCSNAEQCTVIGGVLCAVPCLQLPHLTSSLRAFGCYPSRQSQIVTRDGHKIESRGWVGGSGNDMPHGSRESYGALGWRTPMDQQPEYKQLKQLLVNWLSAAVRAVGVCLNHAAKHAAGDDMQDAARGLKPQLEVLGKLEEQEQRLRQQYNAALQEVLL